MISLRIKRTLSRISSSSVIPEGPSAGINSVGTQITVIPNAIVFGSPTHVGWRLATWHLEDVIPGAYASCFSLLPSLTRDPDDKSFYCVRGVLKQTDLQKTPIMGFEPPHRKKKEIKDTLEVRNRTLFLVQKSCFAGYCIL